MTRPLATILLVSALTLTACRFPGSDSSTAPPAGDLPRELAATPEVLPSPTPADPEGGKGGPGKRGREENAEKEKDKKKEAEEEPVEEDGPSSSKNGGGPDPGTTDLSGAKSRELGTASDASGDHGVLGPVYADLLNVTISARDRLAVVTVDVGAAPPANLAEGEVMGIGVDIFRTTDAESDYQIFADGGVDGWFAYLHTPEGFVEYPGTFAIAGGRLIFQMPWASLGGPRGGRFSGFVDWSGSGMGGVSPSSQDFAPDSGAAAFG